MKVSFKIIYALLLLSACTHSAQNEFSKWYFGYGCGLNFGTSPPTFLPNSNLYTGEGCATICDAGGALLFYTDGMIIRNSANQLMATNLYGGSGSSTQGSIIVKQPGTTDIYYVFTADENAGGQGLKYSIVDMTLAAGLGSVSVSNVPLYTPSCEKQVAVRHCNGKDIWIVTHDYNSNQFRTFLLTSAGLSATPVISAIGETPAGTDANLASNAAIGHLKISPDGKKLAMATYSASIPASLGNGGFHLFDFDPSSGVVSNSLVLLANSNIPNGSGAYGVEFSPDGKKVYGTALSGTSPGYSGTLYQWDICQSTNAAIIASQYSVSTNPVALGSVQWAVNGKLYISLPNNGLGIINNPNASGAAISLALNTGTNSQVTYAFGLPNYINAYIKPVLTLTSTAGCQTATMGLAIPNFSSGCSAPSFTPNAYLWNFGEPVSGTANTSTLSNPTHSYSNSGSYSVSLIIYSPCASDTLTKVLNISIPVIPLNVSGPFTICQGESAIYTVSGGASYYWSNGAINPNVTLSPTTTSIYTVTGYASGCSTSKEFTVTVNPCVGMTEITGDARFKIFPNPVSSLLTINATEAASGLILNPNGAKMLEFEILKGRNEIDTSSLDQGAYYVSIAGNKGVQYYKLMKQN